MRTWNSPTCRFAELSCGAPGHRSCLLGRPNPEPITQYLENFEFFQLLRGGSTTGIEPSPNLECTNFHLGVRPGSKSCFEMSRKSDRIISCITRTSGPSPGSKSLGDPSLCYLRAFVMLVQVLR